MTGRLSDRITLSDVLPREPQLQPTAANSRPRRCTKCGLEDLVTAVQGEYDIAGAPRLEHRVTIELRYLAKKEQCTPYLQLSGWRPKIIQGRPAMERFICRPCLNGGREMEREWAQKRAKELKSGGKNHDDFYLAICEQGAE